MTQVVDEPTAFSLMQIVSVVVTPLTTCIVAWVGWRIAELNRAQTALLHTMDLLHQSTNSKMDLLLKTVADASLAKGLLQGRGEATANEKVAR